MLLKTTAKNLAPVLLVLSFMVFWRGHNSPGGGFIGGLIAAGAFTLYTMSHGETISRKHLWLEPFTWIVLGLACTLISGLIPLFCGPCG
jgi:multicomponent Na+:H+ antiporter subunit B